jgi:subtilisin-like proprotein convertase family protein
MKKIFTFLLLSSLGMSTASQAQTCTASITIPNTGSCTVGSTAVNFYDNGGSAASYTVNANNVYTICPFTAGYKVRVAFSSFATESGYDGLQIFNGNSTASPLLPSSLASGTNTTNCPAGSYYGTTSPGTVNSSDATGCLTFKFLSDGTTVAAGWAATVQQIIPCTAAAPTAALAATSTIRVCGPTAVTPGAAVTLDGTGSTAYTGFSVDDYRWDFGDNTSATVTTATTTHAYTAPGMYLVRLTVSDNNTLSQAVTGCLSNNYISRFVEVVGPPINNTVPANQTINCGATVALAGAASSSSQIEVFPDPPPVTTFLPDGSGVAYTIPVSLNGIFAAGATVSASCLPSITINMEHSYQNDLLIELQAPNGTKIKLHNRGTTNLSVDFGIPVTPGVGPGTGANYTWASTGTQTVAAWCAANSAATMIPAGTYLPVDAVTLLNGAPMNGTWNVIITDLAASDDGYVFDIGITFPAACYRTKEADTPDLSTSNTQTLWSVPAGNPSTPAIAVQTNNNAVYTYASCPAAGTFSPSTGCTGNTITNTASVGPFTAPGAHTINFTVQDEYGCQWRKSTVVTVNNNCCSAGTMILNVTTP